MAQKFSTQFAHHKVDCFMCKTPSKTEQQFEYETNINNIVSGQVQSCLPAQTSQAIYGITVTGDEYINSLNAVSEVTNYFEELPVKAKEFFEYKPEKMLAFIKDDKNFEKAFEIGLIDKKAYNAKKEAFAKLQEEIKSSSNSSASTVTVDTTVTPNSME